MTALEVLDDLEEELISIYRNSYDGKKIILESVGWDDNNKCMVLLVCKYG